MYSQFIHYESPNEPLVRVVSEEEVEELQEIDEAGPVTTLMTIDDMEPETKQSPPLTQPSPAPEPSGKTEIEKPKERGPHSYTTSIRLNR